MRLLSFIVRPSTKNKMTVETITLTIIFNIVRTPLCFKCTMRVNRNQNKCVRFMIFIVQFLYSMDNTN